MARSFNEWWSTVPEDLRNQAKGNDDWTKYKPLLNEINYVLVMLHLQGKHDMKPSGEELLNWVSNGEIDAIRQG
ncbi:MAG: hypothetical protein KatS3mg003_0568 [Candidatus Nitrosocaldaceae archaeon]|nr:MAG: hypothetical protein KatS3mg003_0568 [Candidatus Nitrosocaldaceae archaeon]